MDFLIDTDAFLLRVFFYLSEKKNKSPLPNKMTTLPFSGKKEQRPKFSSLWRERRKVHWRRRAGPSSQNKHSTEPTTNENLPSDFSWQRPISWAVLFTAIDSERVLRLVADLVCLFWCQTCFLHLRTICLRWKIQQELLVISWAEEQGHSSATTIVSARTTKDKWPVHWQRGRAAHKTLLSSSIECNHFFLFARQGKQKKRFTRQANKLPTIVSSEDTERSDSARWVCVTLGEWSKWPSRSRINRIRFLLLVCHCQLRVRVSSLRTTSLFSRRSAEIALFLASLCSCSI